MKKRLLILLFCFGLSALGFAQEMAEPTVFDYEKTKHELSLDIAPIIDGNYPTNLLYRKHYVSKKGNNVALRLGASLDANLGSLERVNAGGNNQGNNNAQSLLAYVGKEWQKTFHPRFIGYYGSDVSFGYGRSFNEFLPNDPNQNSGTMKSSVINLGAIGFLGMKYHISKHISVSVETSAFLNFSHMTRTNFTASPDFTGEETIKSNDLNLSLTPLRAIRFAFHF